MYSHFADKSKKEGMEGCGALNGLCLHHCLCLCICLCISFEHLLSPHLRHKKARRRGRREEVEEKIEILFQNIPIKCNILASAAVNQSGRGHVFSLCFQEQKGWDGMDGGMGLGGGGDSAGSLLHHLLPRVSLPDTELPQDPSASSANGCNFYISEIFQQSKFFFSISSLINIEQLVV